MGFFENDFYGFLPELFLLIASLTLLMFGVIYSTSKTHGQPSCMQLLSWMSLLSLVLTAGLVFNSPVQSMIFFSQALYLDELSCLFNILKVKTSTILSTLF
jgi:hypothetical protein